MLKDVSNLETFASVVKQIDAEMGNSGLDVLINNAGFFIKENQSLDSITKNLVLEYLQVNTFGPLFVTQVCVVTRYTQRSMLANFRLGDVW